MMARRVTVTIDDDNLKNYMQNNQQRLKIHHSLLVSPKL